MPHLDEDIFGQIDALLGKRSPAVLTEKNIQGDDFPTLTEVINTGVLDSQSNVLADSLITGDNAARQVERRVFERRQNSSSDARMILAGGINSPVSEDLESKLMEMFRDQHKNLEKSLRLIIQEELRRNKSDFL
jgi:hypothetical protein